MSCSHQLGKMRRAAKAPAMVMAPMTISQAPRKIATASRPGLGHTMIATPAAIESSPVRTLARRTRASMPRVSASATPSKMNSAPMKVARLRIDHSMLKIRTPATMSANPLNSSIDQLRATRSAAWRVSRWPNSGAIPGATNMTNLHGTTAYATSIVALWQAATRP